MLRELFIRQLRDITIPYLSVFCEVIVVEMAKGVCLHTETHACLDLGIVAHVFELKQGMFFWIRYDKRASSFERGGYLLNQPVSCASPMSIFRLS